MFTDVKQLALSGLYFRDLLHCLLQTVKALCLVELKSYKTENLKHHSAFFFPCKGSQALQARNHMI